MTNDEDKKKSTNNLNIENLNSSSKILETQ